jgi:hypothetical protein
VLLGAAAGQLRDGGVDDGELQYREWLDPGHPASCSGVDRDRSVPVGLAVGKPAGCAVGTRTVDRRAARRRDRRSHPLGRPPLPRRLDRHLPLTSRTNGRDANQPWTALGAVQPLPGTVPAGGTLHYQVQLAALPGHPLSLTPCPGYREQLIDSKTSQVIATEDHQLNCSGLTAVSHVGTRFDMQLAVPRSVPAGTTVWLAWQPSDPTASGTDPTSGDPHYQVTITR